MDKQFFLDLAGNAAGLAEQAVPMVTGSIAEPVAGLAALYHAGAGGDDASGVVNAIREAMTYQPRTEAGKMYQQALSGAVERIVQSAPVRTWKHGVDIAGGYSPTAGAVLATVPTAIGVASGAKPMLKSSRAVSNLFDRVEKYAPRLAQKAESMGRQDGVFAGTMARNADLKALKVAKSLHAAGVSPENIWNQTGWLKAPDGKWRFEIDDRGARILNGKGTLANVIDHPALFEAYPELRNIPVREDVYKSAAHYIDAPGSEEIGINPDFKNESILLHEIQHAIQKREGFELGGSPDESLIDLVRQGEATTVENAYKNLLGEVEARMVQRRRDILPMRYDAMEYREPDLYPYQDPPYFSSGGLDVNPKNIIVRKNEL